MSDITFHDGTERQTIQCDTYINIDNRYSPYSFHPGVVVVSLANGSTRTLAETIDEATFVNLCRRADGNVLGEF